MGLLVRCFYPFPEFGPVPILAGSPGRDQPLRSGPLDIRIAVLVLNAANVDPEQSIPARDAFLDLVVNEFSLSGLSSNENNGDACTDQSAIDQFLHLCVSFLLRFLPYGGIVKAGCSGAFNHSAVPHDVGPPNITFVVEAKKHFSGHKFSPL